MRPKVPASIDGAELRRRAEALVSQRRSKAVAGRGEADLARALHELEVHQIELEMQNEELRRVRDQLELEVEKYTVLYDFAPVGYLTLDGEGVILALNLAAAKLLGQDRSRLTGRRCGTFIAPSDQPVFRSFLRRVFQDGAEATCEVMLRVDKKAPIPARFEGGLASSGRECRVVLNDLTEFKRAEADRLLLSKLESTGVLASGIAHDFNNLLTIIILNLDLAQEIVPPGKDLARRLEAAKQSAVQARGLTQQFITFAPGGPLVRRPTALAGVIRESVSPVFSGSKATCEFALADDLWLADVDEGQIRHVLRNIVLNAREAKPEGGKVAVRARNTTVRSPSALSLPNGKYIQVSVADQGEGISPEALPKIFDPYFSTKQRGERKGMGLGLTVCHSIVRNHQGTIHVESRLGEGSVFHIYLPACEKRVEEIGPSDSRNDRRPGRILVMDDDEDMRTVIGETLRKLGHEVELAEDGRQVIELFRSARASERPFDAILLDLTIRGGMGARQTMPVLLDMDPNVKAIVMSGYANDEAVVEHQRFGFKGVLMKPFDIKKMRQALEHALRS